MTVIQQALFMVDTGLEPGPLTLHSTTGLIGGVASCHASASNNVSGADIFITHPYIAGRVFNASRNGHMIGNNTVGSPGTNPDPLWTCMAGSNDGGVTWSQTITTALNDYDNDGFNTGENGPAGHAMYHVTHNDDGGSPRWWMSAGWWPHHDTDPTGSDSHPYLATSTDLLNWSRVKVDRHFDSGINSEGWINQMVVAEYGNGRLIAHNRTTGAVNISTNDGSSWGGWTTPGYPLQFIGAADMRYTHIKHQGGTSNNWIMVNKHGAIAWSTDNGSNWSTTGSYPNYSKYYPRLGDDTYQNERCAFIQYFPDLYGGCWVWLGAKFTGNYNSTINPMIMYSTNMSTWTVLLNSTDGSSIGLPSDLATYGLGTATAGDQLIEIDGTYYLWLRRDNSVVSGSQLSPYELWKSKGDLQSWEKLYDSPFHDGSGTLYNFSKPTMSYNPIEKRLHIGVDQDGDPADGCGRVGYIDFQ